jgi:hypothetical protein
MLFSEKQKLADEYYLWIKKMKEEKNIVIKDNAIAVITFLDKDRKLKDE